MTIWEVKAGPVDPWTPVVLPGEIDDPIKIAQFKTNGQPKTWSERPRLEFSVEKRKKKPTPRSDVIPFTSGGLVINTKAYAAFGSFLSQFGQILEFDLEDETGYFFNPTLLISCIDKNYRGIFAPRQMYPKSVFLEGTIPAEPVIFKDTASSFTSSIYTNDAGKQILEELAKSHGITGLMFPRADITVAEAETLLAAQRERAAAVAAAEARIRENAVPSPTILVLHAIEAAQLQRLLDDPESVTEAILGHGKDGQGVTDYLELGELWHAIHFMLNGDADFDTEGPLGRAVLGAEEIEHTEISCSHPLLVRQTASALQVLTPELFAERFDAAAMAAEDVYPDGRWEGADAIGIDAILPVYEKLRAFYAAAAQRGDAVLSSDL